MRGIFYFLALSLVLGTFVGCGTTSEEAKVASGSPMRADKRIKVADVSNNTHKLYDVDAIGMLWNGLNESLRSKGLLWMGEPAMPVLSLEAQIVEYKKGNVLLRPVLPFLGKTVLAVKCDLKDGSRVVASVESRHTVSIGSEGFTIGAWKKIFSVVAEDAVNQLARKI